MLVEMTQKRGRNDNAIEKLQKKKSYQKSTEKWVRSPVNVLTLGRSQDSFSTELGGGASSVFGFGCRYSEGLVHGKMR